MTLKKNSGFLVIIIIVGLLSTIYLVFSWTSLLNFTTMTTKSGIELLQKKQACDMILSEAQNVLSNQISLQNNAPLTIDNQFIYDPSSVSTDDSVWLTQAALSLMVPTYFSQLVTYHYLIVQVASSSLTTQTFYYDPTPTILSGQKQRSVGTYQIMGRCAVKGEKGFFESTLNIQILFGDILNNASVQKIDYQLPK